MIGCGKATARPRLPWIVQALVTGAIMVSVTEIGVFRGEGVWEEEKTEFEIVEFEIKM